MKSYLKSIVLVVILSGFVNALGAENQAPEPAPWWLPKLIAAQLYAESPQYFNPRVAAIEFSANTDLGKLEKDLFNIIKDEHIQGVMLIINHAGGSTADLSIVHDMLQKVKNVKPVVGLVMGRALSCGYWVASAADYLIAHRASEIGSIGVYAEIQRWSDIKIHHKDAEASAKNYLFIAGKYKALGHTWRDELSEDEKKYIQEDLDKLYDIFKNTVAQNRGLDIAQAEQWAEGKQFYAAEALKLGFIDEIGTAIEAEAKLVELIRARNPDRIISADVQYIW